jgi:hypothetical protein
MTCELLATELAAEQKGQIFGILSVGCDRETAAAYVGCSPADIASAMRQDISFANTVRRTEAAAELAHMRNVQQAGKDVKNWRASVWWLERRSPERFGARSPGTITARHLKTFIQMLSNNLNSDVRDPDDRQRVLDRLEHIQHFIDDLTDDLFDVQATDENASPDLEPTADFTDELSTDFESDELNL